MTVGLRFMSRYWMRPEASSAAVISAIPAQVSACGVSDVIAHPRSAANGTAEN